MPASDRPAPRVDSAALIGLASTPGASPRLLELVESELEERAYHREYREAVEWLKSGAPARPVESAVLASAAPIQPETPPSPARPPAPATALPQYLDTREAAALLGVSVKTLEALRSRGKGPSFIRVGRRVRYPLDGLRGK